MKYYKNKNNEMFGFELDGSQDHLITEDMTSITIEEIQAINKAKEDEHKNSIEYRLKEAKNYLVETSWIWEKYARNVTVLGNLTTEEFKLKYADIISKQEESRTLINALELQLR